MFAAVEHMLVLFFLPSFFLLFLVYRRLPDLLLSTTSLYCTVLPASLSLSLFPGPKCRKTFFRLHEEEEERE